MSRIVESLYSKYGIDERKHLREDVLKDAVSEFGGKIESTEKFYDELVDNISNAVDEVLDMFGCGDLIWNDEYWYQTLMIPISKCAEDILTKVIK